MLCAISLAAALIDAVEVRSRCMAEVVLTSAAPAARAARSRRGSIVDARDGRCDGGCKLIFPRVSYVVGERRWWCLCCAFTPVPKKLCASPSSFSRMHPTSFANANANSNCNRDETEITKVVTGEMVIVRRAAPSRPPSQKVMSPHPHPPAN